MNKHAIPREAVQARSHRQHLHHVHYNTFSTYNKMYNCTLEYESYCGI